MHGAHGVSGSKPDSYGVSVLRMQHQDAKRLGTAAKELIDAVSEVKTPPKGGNAHGIGKHVDVSG